MEQHTIKTIPEGVDEVYHVSLNDSDRVIRLDLTDALTGSEVLAVHYLKPDDSIGSVSVPSTSGIYIDFTIPSAMTNKSGCVYCKLRVDGIGLKAFDIMVEGGA